MAVSVPVAIGAYVAIDYFADVIIAATGVAMFGNRAFATGVSFVLYWGVWRLFERRRAQSSDH